MTDDMTTVRELLVAVRGPFDEPMDPEPNTHLFHDLGLSSIEFIELINAIEKRYRVEFDETQLAETRTISELVALIGQAQQRAEMR